MLSVFIEAFIEFHEYSCIQQGNRFIKGRAISEVQSFKGLLNMNMEVEFLKGDCLFLSLSELAGSL